MSDKNLFIALGVGIFMFIQGASIWTSLCGVIFAGLILQMISLS